MNNVSPLAQVEKKQLALNRKSVIALFLYYIFVLIVGFLLSAYLFLYNKNPAEPTALAFCISMAMVGASIFYLRKLYKACISDEYNFSAGNWHQCVGTFFYFFLRPIFAIAFSAVLFIISTWTIVISVQQYGELSYSHFILSGLEGFFVGFLAGKWLGRLTYIGEKHMDGLW